MRTRNSLPTSRNRRIGYGAEIVKLGVDCMAPAGTGTGLRDSQDPSIENIAEFATIQVIERTPRDSYEFSYRPTSCVRRRLSPGQLPNGNGSGRGMLSFRYSEASCSVTFPHHNPRRFQGLGRYRPSTLPPRRAACNAMSCNLQGTGNIGVRWIIFITLVLCALFHVACDWGTGPAEPSPYASDWVRTVDGWERPSSWRITGPKPAPLHPLVVASFELLTALLALVGLSSRGSSSHTRDLVSAHATNEPAHLEHADR